MLCYSEIQFYPCLLRITIFRIEKATLTATGVAITPETFHPQRFLDQSWSPQVLCGAGKLLGSSSHTAYFTNCGLSSTLHTFLLMLDAN